MNIWGTTCIIVLNLYCLLGNMLSTGGTNINKMWSSFINEFRPDGDFYLQNSPDNYNSYADYSNGN